jgi:hypothetical protein
VGKGDGQAVRVYGTADALKSARLEIGQGETLGPGTAGPAQKTGDAGLGLGRFKGVAGPRFRKAERERTGCPIQIETGARALPAPLDPSLDNSRDCQGCRQHGLEFAGRRATR